MDVNRIFKSLPKTPLLALLRMIRTNKLALLLARVASVPAKATILKRASTKTPSQTKSDRPRKPPSIWKARLAKFAYKAGTPVGRRRLLMSILIALVIITVIASGTLFFTAQANKTLRQANQVATAQANKNATAQANQIATAQAFPSYVYPSYLSGNGTLIFADSLSQEDEWHNESDNLGNACRFTDGAYHISQQQGSYFNHCEASGTFSNFAFEVQLTIIRGDCGGTIFRNDGKGQYYYFHICRNGTYTVAIFLNNKSTNLTDNKSSVINVRFGQQNTIAVVASGSTMTFYANGQQLGDPVLDSSYTAGNIGLIANPVFGHATEVVYTNARAWAL